MSYQEEKWAVAEFDRDGDTHKFEIFYIIQHETQYHRYGEGTVPESYSYVLENSKVYYLNETEMSLSDLHYFYGREFVENLINEAMKGVENEL